MEPKVPQVSENVSRIHASLTQLTPSITPPMEAKTGKGVSWTQHFPDSSAEILSYSENCGKITLGTSHGNVLNSWLFFDFSLSSQLISV